MPKRCVDWPDGCAKECVAPQEGRLTASIFSVSEQFSPIAEGAVMFQEPWRLTLCGGLSARQGAHVIARFRTQKTGLLLAYLALHSGHNHGREELAELFWPDSDQPLSNLRMALAALRQQLEPVGFQRGDILTAGRTHVSLVPEAVRTDVLDFREAMEQSARVREPNLKTDWLRQGVEAISGELLPGSYMEWVLQAREILTEQRRGALKELTALLTAQEEPESALFYARRRAHLDPLDEEAHVEVMQLLLLLKRPADAQQQFERLTTYLREGLDIAPSPKAYALAASAFSAPLSTLLPADQGPMEPHRLLRSQVAVSLPLPLTPFFGRERELSLLLSLLKSPSPAEETREGFFPPRPPWRPRVVTVLGTGGSGKTRLAIEAACLCAAAGDRAVCFVALADADTSERMLQSIAGAVCPNAPADRDAFATIVSTLGEAAGLLVLDNLEQVAEAGAEALGALLQRLPNLTLLVTSRQRLNLDGERELSLPPLPLPEREDTPECLLEFASVQLFVDRAQAARADFQLTSRNAGSVGALCRRLEGLPLALELAASWAQTLSPAQMLVRLERRFDLLRTRRKGVASRHQALDVCIEWSFRLLDAGVQAFFCRLCLLHGEWTLEMAEIVSGDRQVQDSLQRLREASFLLVREVEEAGGTALRFHMLESLREFGLERLDPSDLNTGYERLTRHYIALSGPDPFATIDAENVRAAVSWCQTSAAGYALELDLLNALTNLWGNRGGWLEGRGWVQAALERHVGESTPAQRKTWNTLGFLHATLGENGQANLCFGRLLADSEQAGDPVMAVRARSNLAIIAVREGDLLRGCALMEQSLRQAESLGDARIIATQNYNVGSAHLELDHDKEARAFLERSLQQSRDLNFPGGIALALSSLAQLARKEGDSLSARQLLEESLSIFRAAGEQPRIAEMIDRLVILLTERGDAFQARVYADESAALHKRLRGE